MMKFLSNGSATGRDARRRAHPFRPGKPAVNLEALEERRLLTRFIEGINYNEDAANNAGFASIPPDPSGVPGINHVVSVNNSSIEWHGKLDGSQQNSESLRSFFAPLSPRTDTFDPKVIYDEHVDRFVVVTLEALGRGDSSTANNESRILLAVSEGPDPNGGWHYFEIDGRETIGGQDSWADYPGFAVDEEAVYVTANMFRFDNDSYTGGRLWVVPKGVGTGGFYDGGAGSFLRRDPVGTSGFSLTYQPAHVFGAAAGDTGTFLVGYGGLSNGISEFASVLRVDDPRTTAALSHQFVDLGDIDNTAAAMPDAPQSGTGTRIETNDRRALNAVWRDDALYFTATVVPGGGADAGQATAYWARIDTSSLGALSLADSGTVGGEDIAPGTFTFFPSIAVNAAGDVAIGFSASAPSIFPGAYWTGRLADDPSGTVRPSEVLAAGQDYYVRTFGSGRNRWGDYTGIGVDPADPDAFWAYNEYALPRGSSSGGEDGRWGTRFAGFTIDPDTVAPTVAIVPVDPDPRTTGVDAIAIEFSEPVYDFELSDLALTRDGSTISLAAATLSTDDGGRSWTLGGIGGLTGIDGTYVLSLSAAGAGIEDLSNNALAVGDTETFVVGSVDTTDPSIVEFNVLYGSRSFDLLGSSRTYLPWQITGIEVVFSEPIAEAGPGSLSGVAVNGFRGLGTDTLTWDIDTLTRGAFSLALLADGIRDAAGNPLNGGDDVAQAIEVLYGDFSDDGVVSSADFLGTLVASRGSFDAFADLDGDGDVDADDVRIARRRVGASA